MATYTYQARDSHGQSIDGLINAESIDDAGKRLRDEGKFIVNLSPTKAIKNQSVSKQAASLGKIKRVDVIYFVQQLAVMLETGVSMSDALDCLVTQCENPAFKVVLRDVTEHVQAGGEFSIALGKHPKQFPNLVVALIRASEISGTLSSMLERISQYMTKEQQILRQAKGALMYPLFMMGMACSVTVFLMVFVIPKFAAIYAGKNAALPGPTKLLMNLSDLLINHWYFWIAGVIALGIALYILPQTKSGQRGLDWIKLNAPICRQLFSKLYLTRACRTMGTMINSGVAMLDMVQIIRNVTNNSYYNDLWNNVDENLQRGAQLSDSFFESPLIPNAISQMIYSGEKAGQLGKVMDKVADYTESEFEAAVKATTQFIEPVMISVMGGIIGFVAIALLLPIFSVGRVMAGPG